MVPAHASTHRPNARKVPIGRNRSSDARSGQEAGLGQGQSRRAGTISDGGNGLEEAIHWHFWDDLTSILDWYHASEHIHDYAKALHPRDSTAAVVWAKQAKAILDEQG